MKKIYFVLFAILCTIVFSCTDNLISDDLDSHKNSSTGELKVFVKQSRLFSPEINNISWTVELVDVEKNTYSSKEIGSYYLFSGLQSGIYYVTASGKDSLGVERFSGSITINFDSTEPLEIHVPVVASKPNNDTTTSTGFATITMDMSEELLDILYSLGEEVILVACLLDIDDTNTDFDVSTNLTNKNYTETQEFDSIDIFDNQQISFVYTDYISKTQTTDIPAGYYNLSFVGLDDFGYSIKLKDNLVEIGNGLTTNIVLTENDYEIVKNYYSILYVNNEGGETADGKTLSNPIAFSKISDDNNADLIYLLSDVEFIYDENSNLSPYLDRISGTISSFGSTVRTISSPEGTTGQLPNCTLKNIKLSGIFSNIENNLYITIEDTVILDCKMASNKPIVYLSKSSNLVVGKNFSGDLYVSLVGEWNLGDTVINFENGKPENSNFYIEENCCNSEFQNYSAMFYIDDSGKLAKYTDDFTSFAWTGNTPHLVTKTQAKNNTYTSIIDDGGESFFGFNGISTYDEENQTWYFICEDASGNTVPSLYKVSASTEYTDTVSPEKIEVSIPDSPAGVNLPSVTAMDYDNGKLYMGFYETELFPFYVIDTASNNSSSASVSLNHIPVDKLTALLVDGDNVYIATTLTDTTQQNVSTTHSAIWQLTLEQTENGYILSPAQTYNDATGATNPVPYYLTQYDDKLTINSSFPEGSTFRITDLYSDGTSVYGLLANYIEIDGRTQNDKVYMRGSVFKLVENTTTVNANHFGLRNSLSISDILTAKQSFILPRKIVGIVNKKLIIADDGMIPDRTDCNLDRFILFDLDGTLSEIIDVNVPFTTSGTASAFATGSLF